MIINRNNSKFLTEICKEAVSEIVENGFYEKHLSKEQYRQLMRIAAANGTNYFTFNVRNTVCNDCGYISKHTLKVCPHCGSTNLDYLTRIIGYLKRIKDFSAPRQDEAEDRYYHKSNMQ